MQKISGMKIKGESEMNKKKLLALGLILILAMGILTGCSPTEKEYYNLTMEASNQKVYEYSGIIDLNLTQLPETMFEGEKALSKELITKAIDHHRIDYSGKADLNQGIFQNNFTIVDIATGKQTAFLSLIYKNDVLYIKVDDMINYLKTFGNSEANLKLDRLFGDTQYVSITGQDLEAMMPPGNQKYFSSNLLQQSAQQQRILQRLFADLINNTYDKYTSNLISKNNNSYVFTVRAADSIDIVKPMLEYTIKNIDKFGMVLKTFVNSLSDEECANLGFPSEMKSQAPTGIDLMVLMVNKNRDKYLSDIGEMDTLAARDSLIKTVNDSEMVSTIQKNNANTYDMTNKIYVHITPERATDELAFTINIKETLKASNAIQVLAPTGTITAFTEIAKRMPQKMNVQVDTGIYSLEKGFSSSSGVINVRLENGQSYVPLKFVAESMGEKVGWDETSQQAYVERDGQRTIMTGIITDDKTLVKSRDFQSLGYKVSWNDLTSTVTIEK
jgi:hypothetical protein